MQLQDTCCNSVLGEGPPAFQNSPLLLDLPTVVWWLKTLSKSHIGVLFGIYPATPPRIQHPAYAAGKQQVLTPGLKFLTPMWKTLVEFLASGRGLVQLQLFQLL